MRQKGIGLLSRTRCGVAVATTIAMALGIAAPAPAAEMATFTGTVLNPENVAATGCTVVFKDIATGQEFKSAPTGPMGEYQVSVPVGGRYKLDSVVAPDGTKLPVQNVPPMPVRVAGSTRMDVKFVSTNAADAAAGAAAAEAAAGSSTSASTASTAPAADEKKKKDKSGVPWWKRPGPIVGMALGGAAILALALSGGGGGDSNPPPASASLP
jgi:hypothetical protein